MLLLLDIGFYILHIFIVAFNLFGWIPTKTRYLHRWCICITASCWLLVGAWYNSIGYCPLTDWHWDVKRLRGQADLPNSFITHLFEMAGFTPSPYVVDIFVGLSFAVIVTIALYFLVKDLRHSSEKS